MKVHRETVVPVLRHQGEQTPQAGLNVGRESNLSLLNPGNELKGQEYNEEYDSSGEGAYILMRDSPSKLNLTESLPNESQPFTYLVWKKLSFGTVFQFPSLPDTFSVLRCCK